MSRSLPLTITEQAYSIPVLTVLGGFPLLLKAKQVLFHQSRITTTQKGKPRETEGKERESENTSKQEEDLQQENKLLIT